MSLGYSKRDFYPDCEFAITFDFRTSMTVINVEIRARKIAENRTFLVFRFFCTTKFLPKEVTTQFDRGDSCLTSGEVRVVCEFGLKK
jgi:hypothetical protein